MKDVDGNPKFRDIYDLSDFDVASHVVLYRFFGITISRYRYLTIDIAVAFGVEEKDIIRKNPFYFVDPRDFWTSVDKMRFVNGGT